MCFRCRSLLLLFLLPWWMTAEDPLRVCADPNNLPFSNEQAQGFENKLAEFVAAKLGEKVQYTWWSQRKSFVRNSLDAGRCDVLIGVPTALTSVTTTEPYYRSTYVFVSRRDRNLDIASLEDAKLSQLRIGIHVVGDDYAPPAIALARRGVIENVTGFSLFGKYGEKDPPRKLIDAVARGEIDLAIVWGPFAGYFARCEDTALEIAPVSPEMFLGVPFAYDISFGVRSGDDALRAKLNALIKSQYAQIQQILSEYGVPLVQAGGR